MQPVYDWSFLYTEDLCLISTNDKEEGMIAELFYSMRVSAPFTITLLSVSFCLVTLLAQLTGKWTDTVGGIPVSAACQACVLISSEPSTLGWGTVGTVLTSIPFASLILTLSKAHRSKTEWFSWRNYGQQYLSSLPRPNLFPFLFNYRISFVRDLMEQGAIIYRLWHQCPLCRWE